MPKRSGLNDREGSFSPSDYSCSRINSSAERVDSSDFWDGQTRDVVQRHAKEAKSGRICLDKWSDAASYSRPQQEKGDTFFGSTFGPYPSKIKKYLWQYRYVKIQREQ